MSETLVVRDQFKPTSKQAAFFEACDEPGAEEILFDGSIRGGKSQGACKKLVAWAWQYGGRYLVARKTYRELMDSTLAVFLRGEGDLPPACPPELVQSFMKAEMVVFLKNGAEIMFRSLENREDAKAKLRNLSLNAAFIDQVEELDDDADAELYEELLGRLSDPRGPGKMLLAANPGPIDHWVHKRFIDPDTRKPWTRYIHVTLYDNRQNLSKKYFDSRVRTQTSNPEYYRRFILGEWGSFGGKRFKNWDGDRHICEPFPVPNWWEIIESVDYGHKNPTAVLLHAVSPDGRWFVIGEHYEAERGIRYHSGKIRELRDELGVAPSVTWIDPAAWQTHQGYESIAIEFGEHLIYTAKAENERLGGWARIDDYLQNNLADGKPQLQIFDTCKNLIRELPSAKIKEGTDDIEKRNDHALDALRYAIMSRPPLPVEPEAEEDVDLRDAYARKMIEKAFAREGEEIYYG